MEGRYSRSCPLPAHTPLLLGHLRIWIRMRLRRRRIKTKRRRRIYYPFAL